jgi:hypothetical protein
MQSTSRRERAKKERSENPQARDTYLKRCGEISDEMFKALEQNKNMLSEADYLSIAETAEYLEDQSTGIEGVDF